MSSLSRVVRLQNVTRRSTVSMISQRSFHSPFSILSETPSASSTTASPSCIPYEKSMEISPEPRFSYGRKTYVVSEPDPLNTPYKVPAGAYPTSEPYVNYEPTSAPESHQMSSTSPTSTHPRTRNVNELKEGGPPSLGRVAEKFSKMRNAEAWKARN